MPRKAAVAAGPVAIVAAEPSIVKEASWLKDSAVVADPVAVAAG